MKFWQSFDIFSFLFTLSLLLLGLLTIYSVSLGNIKTGGEDFFIKQIYFSITGLVLYFLFSWMDYRYLRNFVFPIYIISLSLLVFTYIWGLETRGSTRWIDLNFVKVQPSEFIKLSLVLLLSTLFSTRSVKRLKNIIVPIFITALPVLLIFKQPDLGSTGVIIGIFFGLLYAAGIKLRYLLTAVTIVAILTPLGWNVLQDYQRERLLTFLNPQSDPLGKGYNVIQSLIAVGSGQITGRGFGRGTQSHLNFLPEHHTDFIFATLSEELGLIGATLVLGLSFALIFRLFKIASESQDIFGSLIVVGVALQVMLQLFINVGMNIGLLPVTGITLPLISYGGSSLITILASLGITQSIRRYTQELNKEFS